MAESANELGAPAGASLLDLMSSRLQNKLVWKDMIEIFERVMEINVEGPIKQLEVLRHFSNDKDSGILNSTARMLGFDLSQDVLNMNESSLTKIVSQLSMYADQNGTELFVKFIDLLLNSKTQIEYLWTKDYVNFYPEPKGTTLYDGGNWFKTTHINITTALFNRDSLVLAPTQTLSNRVRDLFYTFAPVNLVIYKQDFAEYYPDTEWQGGCAIAFGAGIMHAEREVVLD